MKSLYFLQMLQVVRTGPRGTRAGNVFMLQKYTFMKSQSTSVRLVIMLQAGRSENYSNRDTNCPLPEKSIQNLEPITPYIQHSDGTGWSSFSRE